MSVGSLVWVWDTLGLKSRHEYLLCVYPSCDVQIFNFWCAFIISVYLSVTALQENLSELGDKLEGPRQDLEQAKKDEAERKGKIEKMRMEIEVRKGFGSSQLSRTQV